MYIIYSFNSEKGIKEYKESYRAISFDELKTKLIYRKSSLESTKALNSLIGNTLKYVFTVLTFVITLVQSYSTIIIGQTGNITKNATQAGTFISNIFKSVFNFTTSSFDLATKLVIVFLIVYVYTKLREDYHNLHIMILEDIIKEKEDEIEKNKAKKTEVHEYTKKRNPGARFSSLDIRQTLQYPINSIFHS
ncbi:hypothetical protein DNHGIG_40420 [Collibacillus ludicampi]|uniref:ABC transmembrane type-1 domain-containing protein n=1 Tax=Collibacillus ludicampi TaxID=2771369 RepID=A0AAV4LM58_9BACL|nr:hypothetical protein [Collibacillus ludicampi]GIM48493.1 hypothetical protein DNHGIG_40420 [Collibacillus ludicampi]